MIAGCRQDGPREKRLGHTHGRVCRSLVNMGSSVQYSFPLLLMDGLIGPGFSFGIHFLSISSPVFWEELIPLPLPLRDRCEAQAWLGRMVLPPQSGKQAPSQGGPVRVSSCVFPGTTG